MCGIKPPSQTSTAPSPSSSKKVEIDWDWEDEWIRTYMVARNQRGSK
jgi:hypothetical protein